MTNICEAVVQPAAFSVTTNVLVPLGIAVIGALAGAWFGASAGAKFAFKKDKVLRDMDWKQRKNEREQERQDSQIHSAHQLLFSLLQQLQDLYHLQKFVGENETDKLLLSVLREALINKRELAFIARTHPNELNDAVIAEHEYLQAFDALTVYNEYTRVVQDFCREHAVRVGPENGVIIEVDHETHPMFQIDRQHKSEAFEQLTKAVKRGIEQNKKASAALSDLFNQLFPEEHFHKPLEEGQ